MSTLAFGPSAIALAAAGWLALLILACLGATWLMGRRYKCGCVWSIPRSEWAAPCEANDNGEWLCQRPKGHKGEHVACTPGRHNLHRWK